MDRSDLCICINQSWVQSFHIEFNWFRICITLSFDLYAICTTEFPESDVISLTSKRNPALEYGAFLRVCDTLEAMEVYAPGETKSFKSAFVSIRSPIA